MKRVLGLTFLLFVSHNMVFAQAKARKTHIPAPDRDQLGITCTQILDMSSTDWVGRVKEEAKEPESGQQKTFRAIRAYGKCYDARTDRLVASLAKARTVPPMDAMGDFRNFEQALEIFTSKALAVTEPPADAVKIAYAQLYEKQFRYEFYQSYEKKPVKSPEQLAQGSTSGTSLKAGAPVPAPSSATVSAPIPSAIAPGDSNPVTTAKNHFGELLGTLPENKEHELHSAFGDIVGRSQIRESTRLEIYRYAIFLLEPASASPFVPPPF